jgi:DNA topoisomerase-1
MRIAQSLYEGVSLDGETAGLITYMRTDSFNVSNDAKNQAYDFINKTYGKDFIPETAQIYFKKVKGAQEAHEAIHPTDVFKTPEKIKSFLSKDQFRLYELIWLKFTASQMADAVFENTTADISAGSDIILRANGRAVKFEGYLKVYSDSQQDAAILPALNEGDKLNLLDVLTKQHSTQSPPLYNEASLVKIMERHGIGRPSTYAPIIKTILDRKYAEHEKGKKLIPTDLGVTVTEKLKDFFPDIMELSYTAEIEEKLDKIADGDIGWVSVVKDFYNPFLGFLKHADKQMKPPEPQKTDEICPVCGKKMVLRQSRYGKYLSCEDFPNCKGKIPLDKEGKKILPEKTDKICPKCKKPMVIRTGRLGRFLACSDYPKCKTTASLNGGRLFTPVKTDRPCDKCKKPMVLRKSARGYFLGCSGFPKCKNTQNLTPEEVQKLQKKEK